MVKHFESIIADFVKANLPISRNCMFSSRDVGGLGLSRVQATLDAHWARLWALTAVTDDAWQISFRECEGGDTGWGGITWPENNPAMRVLVKAWARLRRSVAVALHLYLDILLGSGCLRILATGAYMTTEDMAGFPLGGRIWPETPLRALCNERGKPEDVTCLPRNQLNDLYWRVISAAESSTLEKMVRSVTRVVLRNNTRSNYWPDN